MQTNNTNTLAQISAIITHGGQAHRDDFMSVSIALALINEAGRSNVPVFRSEPTKEELADACVLVLDVGGQLQPELNNFDHHQLERDVAPDCALSLLLKALGLWDDFQSHTLGAGRTAQIDSKGPFAAAKGLGIEPKALFALSSPIEGALLSLFEAQKGLVKDYSLLAMMARLGMEILNHVRDLRMQLDFCKEFAKDSWVGDEGEEIHVLVLESSNTRGTQNYRDLCRPSAAVCVSYDDRGEGWSLYRFNDDRRVDFSQLEGREEIAFAHKGGFIAKTKSRIPLDEVLALVKAALK